MSLSKPARTLGVALILLVTVLCPPGFGAEPAEPVGDDVVQVSADRLEADDAARRMVFAGNAVARQGNISIAAERLIIEYGPEDRQVRSIVAEEGVRIEQENRVATAERAVYEKTEERILLTGSPTVAEDGNSVSGEEIVLFLDQRASIVKGGSEQRVKAIFRPGSRDAL